MQTRLGLRFVPFPGPSSSGVWQARSLRLIASPVPAAQFSGCTPGAPSQADGDCPEPPEVLVSKEACLQFAHPERPSLLPPRTIPLGRLSAPAPSIQYHALNLDW